MILKVIKRFCSSATPSFSDFVICGGGLIGTTAACTLAKHPSFQDKTVTLIEAASQPNFTEPTTYSNRVSAISLASKNLFDRLGVWKHVSRFKEVYRLKVWGAYSDNYLELDNKDQVLAYIVENGELVKAILHELDSLSNVKLTFNKSIADINVDKVYGLPKVLLGDGSEYSCQLLIGSDGINSKVRKAMDISYLSWNYEQMAIVATLNISTIDCNNTAWQKFLPDGPIALLPLTNDLSSLVWFSTKEKVRNLLNLPKENFVDAINNSLTNNIDSNSFVQTANEGLNRILNSLGFMESSVAPQIVPHISDVMEGSRAAFPLGFGHSIQYVSPHMILIGDAAHRVHPLAGQGVNLGFNDILCLENVLCEGYINGREIGDIEDLRKYESLCQQNNVPVMAFIELIHRIYTSPLAPVQALGDVCLKFANFFDPLKNEINKRALFLRA